MPLQRLNTRAASSFPLHLADVSHKLFKQLPNRGRLVADQVWAQNFRL